VTVGLLRDSFYALKRQAAPGVDGAIYTAEYTVERIGRNPHAEDDGLQRPLGMAALEDKVVQQAVVTILNQIHKVDFKGFS
jgi:hypothetical protein